MLFLTNQKYSLKLMIIIGFIMCINQIYALNDSETIEQLIADIFEQYTAESEVDVDFASFYEDLIYLSKKVSQNKLSALNFNELAY